MTLRRTLSICTSIFCLSVACGGTLDFGERSAPNIDAPADTSVNPAGPFSPGDVDPNATLEPGWTWLNPKPQGNDLVGVSGTGPHDIWLGDRAGGIWHFDGTALQKSHQGRVDMSYYAIWASAPDDVWVAGEDGWPATTSELLHFDGKTWSNAFSLRESRVHALWGTHGEVWAVLDDGWLAVRRGSVWTKTAELVDPNDGKTPLVLRDIWGSGPSDIWAVGDNAALAHFDGTTWTVSPNGTWFEQMLPRPIAWHKNDLFGIWGSAANDVWVAAHDALDHQNRLYHFDGSSWSLEIEATGPSPIPHAYPHPSQRGRRVWGTGPSDILANFAGERVYHYDGSTWRTRASMQRLTATAFWGTKTTGLLAVGHAGELVRHEPAVERSAWATAHPEEYRGPWTPIFPAVRTQLRDVIADGTGSLYALTRDGVYTWASNAWQRVSQDIGHGCTWRTPHVFVPSRASGFWMAANFDCPAPAGRRAALWHFDGHHWSTTPYPGDEPYVTSMWAPSDDEQWTTSDTTIVRHRSGSHWETFDIGLGKAFAVTGTGPKNVWIAACAGADCQDWRIHHFDGSALRQVHEERREDHPTRAIFARGRNVWIGGSPGIHFDGSRWKSLTGATDYQIDSIAGHGNATYFLAVSSTSYQSRVFADDGSTFRDLGAAVVRSPQAITTHKDGTLWLVGEMGMTLRYVPEPVSAPGAR